MNIYVRAILCAILGGMSWALVHAEDPALKNCRIDNLKACIAGGSIPEAIQKQIDGQHGQIESLQKQIKSLQVEAGYRETVLNYYKNEAVKCVVDAPTAPAK